MAARDHTVLASCELVDRAKFHAVQWVTRAMNGNGGIARLRSGNRTDADPARRPRGERAAIVPSSSDRTGAG